MNQQADLLPEPEKKVTKVRYRIVSADAAGIKGIVELEATGYRTTVEGTLIVYGEGGTIIEYAAGGWRSCVNVELFNQAFKGGMGDELPKRVRAAP
jgi:hypothetical protein